MSVKIGDEVKVTAGKEKGKEGTVIRVDRKNDRAAVKGLNMIKKYEKLSQTNQNGGVVEKKGSIHVSDVTLIDPESGKSTRIGRGIANGNRVRIAKVSDRAIDKK